MLVIKNTNKNFKQPLLNNHVLIRIFLLIFIPIVADNVYAHEQWFLLPDEMNSLDAKPRPVIFSHLTLINISIFLFSMLCIFGWILLGRQGGGELFPDHQIRLSSYGNSAAVVLRFTTAFMLLMAVFGLNPRSGVAPFTSTTLIFPDLQLNLLADHWMWLKWVQLTIALGLLFGVYVRLMATLLLLVGFLGLYLYGLPMLYYIGFVTGIALYLIFQGPGAFYFHLPAFRGIKNIYHLLIQQPIGRSQFLLRVLIGLSFAYTGFIYKFIHPNLAIGLLTMRHMPTFGLNIETVVFWMAIVETFSGILLVIGALTRPIAFLLLGCFLFMSFAVDEPFLSHTIFYGALISCYLNGAGQWRQAPAKDKSAHIVILGASLAGIACARKLERLLGNVTNVKITIVHNESYVQYDPLLPEVISGTIQPGNIINSIRRICQAEQFIQGEVKAIDQHHVEVTLLSGERHLIPYDQLIIAYGKMDDYSTIPGFEQYAVPIRNVGDALNIRKCVLECLEKAEYAKNPAEREMLLTFVVISGGLRGTSVAAEIQGLIKSALICYPKIQFDEIKIYLLDKHTKILPLFNKKIAAAIHKHLLKMNISIISNANILTLDDENIVLTSGKKIPCRTKISAVSKYYPYNLLFQMNTDQPISINDHLQIEGKQNIFIAGITACFAHQVPFQAMYEIKLGQLAAYNAWALSQGFQLHRWKFRKQFFSIASLGQNASSVQLGNIILKGQIAWVTSRLVCMLAMPGLEKNLRVLVDWVFNFPFRKDMVVFSMSQTNQSISQRLDSIDDIYQEQSFPYLLYSRKFAVLRTDEGETKIIFGHDLNKSSVEICLLKSLIWYVIAEYFGVADLIILNCEEYAVLFADVNPQNYKSLIINIDESHQTTIEAA